MVQKNQISIDNEDFNEMKTETLSLKRVQQQLCDALSYLNGKCHAYKQEANTAKIEAECILASTISTKTSSSSTAVHLRTKKKGNEQKYCISIAMWETRSSYLHIDFCRDFWIHWSITLICTHLKSAVLAGLIFTVVWTENQMKLIPILWKWFDNGEGGA